jgi:NAD-dependent dihydropyrimidine dehydrogenase PreA subunit
MKMEYFESGTLAVDEGKCTGCGRCKEVCPHNVFEICERKARIINRKSCMECGACMKNCPVSAVSVAIGTGCAQAILKGGKNGTVECGCSDSGGSCCG